MNVQVNIGIENLIKLETLFLIKILFFLNFLGLLLLLLLFSVFRDISILPKTWTTKTKKGTIKQNMSQMSMNFRYAVAGNVSEMLWYIVYMTSMMVRTSPIAKSKSCLLKNNVISAMNNWNKKKMFFDH